MNESEFGNISWVFYATAAYVVVAGALFWFALMSRIRFTHAQKALKDEGFSADKAS